MAGEAGGDELDEGGTVADVPVLTALGMFDRFAGRSRRFDPVIELSELAPGEPPPLIHGDTL
jgi:hypothetical protein